MKLYAAIPFYEKLVLKALLLVGISGLVFPDRTKEWSHFNTSINDFYENLGYSKSKLYRIMMPIIGKSPSSF